MAQGLSLPTPKGIQQAAAKAGQEAKQAVEAAVSSVTPAQPAKAIGIKFRNPIAPLTAAAGGAQRAPLGMCSTCPASPTLKRRHRWQRRVVQV